MQRKAEEWCVCAISMASQDQAPCGGIECQSLTSPSTRFNRHNEKPMLLGEKKKISFSGQYLFLNLHVEPLSLDWSTFPPPKLPIQPLTSLDLLDHIEYTQWKESQGFSQWLQPGPAAPGLFSPDHKLIPLWLCRVWRCSNPREAHSSFTFSWPILSRLRNRSN